MKIGIIVGSVREGAVGHSIGDWVAEQAAVRTDAQFEVIRLADHDLPFFTGAMPPMMLNKQYGDERVTRWSDALDACDGFVFVTPEYNHGIPGAFKNAIDWLSPELTGKAVGFVGYSYGGALRAVEQWRTVLSNFSMYDVRAQVAIDLVGEFGAEGFAPLERRASELSLLLDQVVDATTKLRGSTAA